MKEPAICTHNFWIFNWSHSIFFPPVTGWKRWPRVDGFTRSQRTNWATGMVYIMQHTDLAVLNFILCILSLIFNSRVYLDIKVKRFVDLLVLTSRKWNKIYWLTCIYVTSLICFARVLEVIGVRVEQKATRWAVSIGGVVAIKSMSTIMH